MKTTGQEYLLNYGVLRMEEKDLQVLWQEIKRWVDEPYRLFRGYSLHYLHLLFQGEQVSLGAIHRQVQEAKTE